MNTCCSVAALESLLEEDLPKERATELYRHLEECPACSAALEQIAGGTQWCHKAAMMLADDELDIAIRSHEPWSEVDFTVEHLDPADGPNVLGRLGGYDVLEIIGQGGMGIVLKGFDQELNRFVAIKVLAPHLARNSLARKRFAREAQAAAAVVHPHVLAIHQVQPGGPLPFLVMPLVAGESLAERLKAQGTLELKEILRIGIQAAAGLAAAHEQGLVHRDVKPANILLERGVERTVLTDFGLARAADDVTLTRWGVIAGTPQYMSPEQARGEALDGRSDLFSLGCVLYEMATGVSPFRLESVMATMRRLVDDPPEALSSLNPELPLWFVAVVNRLLEKDRAHRFDSAKQVSELLEACLAHVQQPASVPLPAGLPKPDSRGGWRSKLRLKGVLAMIGALGIGLFGVLLATSNPPDIAGKWTGEDWGNVVLTKTSDTQYTGTYSRTVGGKPGDIQLNWSRIEHRFNGTWSERQSLAITPDTKALVASTEPSAHGKLSLRLVGDEIRGARTTDPKSSTSDAATPRLADLTWQRTVPNKSQGRSRTSEPQNDLTSPAQATRSSETPLWNAFGVTPAPVSTLTAKVLESIGLHLRPITREYFREKNVFAKYPGGLDVTFVRTHGPAEKAGIHEIDIVVGLQGQPTLLLKDLDQAVQDGANQIKRGNLEMFRFEVLRNGETVQVDVPFSVRDLDPRSPVGSGGNATPSPHAKPDVVFDEYVSVAGTMQPPTDVSRVWSQTNGTIAEVLVSPGQQVQAGQAMIRMNSSDEQEQVDAQQALVRQFSANLVTLKAAPRQASKGAIDIARAELDKARAQTESARLKEAYTVKLRDEKVVAISEVTLVRTELRAAEADEKIAQARLDALLQQPADREREIEETAVQLESAKSQLAESRKLLAACTIRSPIEGVVISIHAVPDQLVGPQSKPGAKELFEVTSTQTIDIRAQIPPDQASQIDPGKDVVVQFDHQGTVVRWTGHLVMPDPEHVGNPLIVRVAIPDWRLYRAGGIVTLRFKLRRKQTIDANTPIVDPHRTSTREARPE